MQTAIQLLVLALQIGAVYVLFSLGLTLIFGVMRIINFAHGQYFTLSALLVTVLMPLLIAYGWPVVAAFVVAGLLGVTAAMILGFVTYQFGFRFFQRDIVGSFILSLGLGLLLEAIFLDIFGGTVRSAPEIVSGTISVLGAPVTKHRLVLCIAAVTFTAALYCALTMTRMGKALRAVSIDHEAAMLQGIPYKRIALQGFMIATMLAAIAGVFVAPVAAIGTTLGSDYLIKGFIAVIVGGLGSVSGAIVGSLFIALIESVGGYYFDPSIANIMMFVLVITVLLVRPQGLMGHV